MVKVHVRIRPLSKEEEAEGHEVHNFNIENDSNESSTPSTCLSLKEKCYEGFATVLSPSANNRYAYVNAVQPLISSVFQGNTVCCFCYGHTNSGKTHTIVGYGLEEGMYKHTAKELFQSIDSLHQLDAASGRLLVQVRFAELYNGRIYDLLDGRKECHVREDSEANIHIRSATQMGPNGEVLVQSLKAEYAKDFEQVVSIVSKATNVRSTGTSELHDQSSRSHALLELEVVTPHLAQLREQVVIAESEIVPIGKKRDGMFIQVQSKCYSKDEKGGYVHNPNGATAEEHAELEQLNKEVAAAQEIIDKAKGEVQKALAEGPPIIGGRFVFVDLAGAEFTGEGKFRTAAEKKEAREINTSLLSLKECIRAQHRQSTHIPFRNSKLTMILKPYLDSRDASTVMITNVSSSTKHLSKTINTIQYASLVAGATSDLAPATLTARA